MVGTRSVCDVLEKARSATEMATLKKGEADTLVGKRSPRTAGTVSGIGPRTD